LALTGLRRLIVGIKPLDETCTVVTPRVAKVIAQNAPEDEALPKLKAQNLIAQVTGDHPCGVFLGCQVIRVSGVIPEPPAGEYPAEVKLTAERLACLVQRVTHAPTPHVGVDVHVRAVQGVRGRIMIGEIAAVGDTRPRVRPQWIGTEPDDERGARTGDSAFHLRDEL